MTSYHIYYYWMSFSKYLDCISPDSSPQTSSCLSCQSHRSANNTVIYITDIKHNMQKILHCDDVPVHLYSQNNSSSRAGSCADLQCPKHSTWSQTTEHSLYWSPVERQHRCAMIYLILVLCEWKHGLVGKYLYLCGGDVADVFSCQLFQQSGLARIVQAKQQ